MIGTIVALSAIGGVVSVVLRRAVIRARFMNRNLEEVRRQNREIAQAWRNTKNNERKLVVKREFTPPGLFSPTIEITQTFER